jgi:hypothetical protein
MKQQAMTGFEKYGKATRRAQFLADMDRIIPWPTLLNSAWNRASNPGVPMRSHFVTFPLVLAGAIMLNGCSKQDASPDSAATAAASATTPAASKVRGKACDMVTQAEMSEILGGAVNAAATEGGQSWTQCIYSPVTGTKPLAVELKVEWGAGPSLAPASSLANTAAPIGAVDPLQGIGDLAVQVPGLVLIKVGDDLMTVQFVYGDTDLPGKARRIFDTAKSRL